MTDSRGVDDSLQEEVDYCPPGYRVAVPRLSPVTDGHESDPLDVPADVEGADKS